MWSVRMLASRAIGPQLSVGGIKKLKIRKTLNSKLSTLNSEHISGAEGIYEKSEIQKVCKKYIKRAFTHPRGEPDEIAITIEKIRQKPKKISLLSVATLRCLSPEEARKIITRRLSDIGISHKAVNNALNVLRSEKTMRGASLIFARSGARVEPDEERGVRVSRMGIEKSTGKNLSKKLSRAKINITTVKEALVLASKAASWPDIIAEVCISDDPDYTTGYIASKEFGYMRIPNIKREKKMHGGRVFFIRETADIARLIFYLERKPAIII